MDINIGGKQLNYQINVVNSITKPNYGPYRKIKTHDPLITKESKCIICLNYYSPGEYKRNLNCNHTFHKKCIDKWFKLSYKTSCPICRKIH